VTVPLLVIGMVFASFAGVMAFLIAYEESGHHFRSKSDARRHALGSAVGAFLFFGVLAIAVAVAVPRAVQP
jgi:hypothetical protein